MIRTQLFCDKLHSFPATATEFGSNIRQNIYCLYIFPKRKFSFSLRLTYSSPSHYFSNFVCRTLPVGVSEHLPNLTQLTLEDNSLRSLAGLSTLQHLLELYVGNNQVLFEKRGRVDW